MQARAASREDLIAIRQVADAAHWDTYSGLLKPDTIGRLLSRDFSPSALRRRLIAGGMMVVEAGGRVVGVIDARWDPGVTRIATIVTEPAHRRRGVGTALIEAVQAARPDHPIRADVLLGNLDGERFYEALGFAPGEVLNGEVFEEDIVERRWWRAP